MLRSENLLLRAIEPSDLELMHQWENNPAIWHLGRTVSPFSKYSIEEYIRHVEHDIFTTRQLRFVIEQLREPRKTIGYIDLYEFDPLHRRAGVGVLIGDEAERRKRNASEALRTLIHYSFRILNLRQLFCFIPENNFPSKTLFGNNGFKEAGILQDWLLVSGEWIPVVIMQLINHGEEDSEE
jgi:diamine N-acetyltransferase